MKKLLGVCVVALILGGCATNGLTVGQNATLSACNSMTTLLDGSATTPGLTALRKENKLSAGQIKSVNVAVAAASPICSNPLPTNNSTNLSIVTNSVTSLQAVLAALGVK